MNIIRSIIINNVNIYFVMDGDIYKMVIWYYLINNWAKNKTLELVKKFCE